MVYAIMTFFSRIFPSAAQVQEGRARRARPAMGEHGPAPMDPHGVTGAGSRSQSPRKKFETAVNVSLKKTVTPFSVTSAARPPRRSGRS